MIAWIESHERVLWWLAAASMVLLFVSAIAAPFLLGRIPIDYYAHTRRSRKPWADLHPVMRALLVTGKNALGLVFVVAGIAMLLLPGPGIITVLAGLMLLDFPRRHRLERWIVLQPRALRSINWVRQRNGYPPLVADDLRGATVPAPRMIPATRSMNWKRAIAIWLLIVVAESVHGAIRQFFITPALGDLRARQLGVFIGSALILLICWSTARWLNATTLKTQLRIGLLWVALIVLFEFGLGTALGYTWERMLADYNVARGGLMGFGLLFLLFAPMLAARLRGV
jgi:hypothetical protein